ncbi:MAG: regulatory protein RecX [Bacteroidales bacterium]|nr:regulatory protein RecX [Bacteroidales bacterium]
MLTLTPPQALNRAAAFCSKSEHCISEVNKKLKDWGISKEDSETIISRLLKEKFIDEERFTRSFVNDKYKYSKWGKTKISYSLKLKNISAELISSIIDEIIPDENYSDSLLNLLQKKVKSVKADSKIEISSKLFRFAASRGYEPSEIIKALKKLNYSLEE